MPTLYIDKNILINNIEITKKLAMDSDVIGVVKGNGYGLGLIPYAHLLTECGIEILAVTELADAIALRNSGIHCDILMLSPLYSKTDIYVALQHHLILCITSYACGELAEQIAKQLNMFARAHICVDTGLGRYGFPDTQIKEIKYTIQHMKHIDVTGIFSHFHSAACKKKAYTIQQYQQFTALCNTLERENIFIEYRHIAASCGLLRFPETRLDAVRIGSAFLGRLPFSDKWGYKPVGILEASIEEVNTLPPGHTIGYGHTYITTKKTTIAVINAGYSHGLGIKRNYNCPHLFHLPKAVLHLIKDTLFPKKLYAYCGENCFPVLGKIGMNSLVIDITDTPLSVGDTVQFPVNPLYVDSEIARVYK